MSKENENGNFTKPMLNEVYLVKKGKKFMKGHGYSTLKGYKFNWTFDKNEARKMEHSTANSLAILSGGSALHFASLSRAWRGSEKVNPDTSVED